MVFVLVTVRFGFGLSWSASPSAIPSREENDRGGDPREPAVADRPPGPAPAGRLDHDR